MIFSLFDSLSRELFISLRPNLSAFVCPKKMYSAGGPGPLPRAGGSESGEVSEQNIYDTHDDIIEGIKCL